MTLLRDLAAMPAETQVLAAAIGITVAAWMGSVLWIIAHAMRNADGRRSGEKARRR